MESYLKIGTVHLKYHLRFHLLAAVLLFCLMPFLMSTDHLRQVETARTLEFYGVLYGIVFLVPIFMADQDRDIRELLLSKKMSMTAVHGIRLAESLIFLAAAEGACVFFLKGSGCIFPMGSFFLGTMAGALFLGGIGMVSYAVTDNPAVGYMIPLVYYMINFGGDKYVKQFYLFSMMQGDFGPKYWLGAAGIFCLGLGICWRQFRP